MSHDHHDHRSLGITSLNKAFVIGIVLNAGFVVAEFILTIFKNFCQSELLMCYHIGISPLRWIGI